MIIAVAASLFALALVDGACAGFRSSVGRTGLINHRASDLRAARRGLGLVVVLLLPAIALIGAQALLQAGQTERYLRAGEAMLAVYAPYALVVLAALACYVTLGWRQRYLAAAVVLGPLTLLRPGIAVLGAALAAYVSHSVGVAIAAVLSVAAALAVEPIANRLWYKAG